MTLRTRKRNGFVRGAEKIINKKEPSQNIPAGARARGLGAVGRSDDIRSLPVGPFLPVKEETETAKEDECAADTNGRFECVTHTCVDVAKDESQDGPACQNHQHH